MGYIYKISTSCSDKIYIGKTQQSIQNRYQEHIKQCRNGVKYHLYNAMRKYGIDTFQISLIEECNDDILNEREKYWIQYYDSFYNGYNMTLGGEGNSLYDYKEIANKYLELKNEQKTAEYFGCSVNTVQKACNSCGILILKTVQQPGYWDSQKGQLRKEKMSKKWKNNNPNKNGLSEEHKKKLSDAKKEYYKNHDNYFKGKKFSEEHKQNLIKNSAMAKSVLCIETGIIYSSALQAAKAVGLKSSAGISKCCNGQRNTAGGYSWQYAS